MCSPVYLRKILFLNIVFMLGACAVTPKNLDSQQAGAENHFLRLVHATNLDASVIGKIELMDDEAHSVNILQQQFFSRGDLLKLKIQSMPEFDGLYTINSQGELELPFSQSVVALHKTRSQLIKEIQKRLYDSEWFATDNVFVELSLVNMSSIDVSVYGAVFNQGRVTINSKPALKASEVIQHEAGTYASGRDLVAAISAAGGIRPDADLFRVIIKRQGRYFSANLEQLISGAGYGATPNLVHGDQIFVMSNGAEDTSLIRPSQITPPGMRVQMSNLTAPALSNAQSAIGADATRLPYGSSLLDAAVSANCVGGTHQANASRSILLITRHYGAKEQIVIRRSINQLLAGSSDYSVNPYLMPNDGVACYDSKFTNIRDVARGIGELFGPVILGGIL